MSTSPIDDDALIGNCRSAALVRSDGSIGLALLAQVRQPIAVRCATLRPVRFDTGAALGNFPQAFTIWV